MGKRMLGIDVLTAARQRIARVFDDFPRVYVSFSGGKDSGAMLELVADEARARGRRIGVLFIDLEGQYEHTISYIRLMMQRHADLIDPYWVALPLNLRNAVSVFEPQWMCWDPDRRADWIRPIPEEAIADEAHFPFFKRRMEFEEFTPEFGHWYSGGKLTCCFVGIRSQESLNRWRTIASQRKRTHDGLQWTTWVGQATYNAYPIYDWATEDIWTFHSKYPHLPHNSVYDLMYKAGVPIHTQRICQPYGDDQRRGLWLYHLLEPETWGRVVARVNGANSGAMYAREHGNINGYRKISKPPHLTWKEFAYRLVRSMPRATQEHYANKIGQFVRWWAERGYPDGIPDEGDYKLEIARKIPSWRRVCKTLLSNDWWCKRIGFTQHKSAAYAAYLELMRKRRQATATVGRQGEAALFD